MVSGVCPPRSPVPPTRLVKEEFVHDCVQMEVPPGREQGAKRVPRLPPAEPYHQPLPPLQLPESPHVPGSLCPALPMSPPGKTLLNPSASLRKGLWGVKLTPPPPCVPPTVAPGSSLLSLPHGEGLLQIACPTPPPVALAQPPPQNGYPKLPYHSEYQGHPVSPGSARVSYGDTPTRPPSLVP